jgi:phosphatidylglycerol---prolipoprotein diacylglyceryl transferase
VLPLCLSMAIGRVGCFLTGLADQTYGYHTSLPWAVDFGDGPRHPTQLYDVVFLSLLACLMLTLRPSKPAPGVMFRLFVFSYCLYRFAVEFLKPSPKPLLGLSAIQVASLVASIVCYLQFKSLTRPDSPSELLSPDSSGGSPHV